MFSSVFRGSSYDRSGKNRDGEHEGDVTETVGSSRRRTLPPHEFPYPGVEFVMRDLEDCEVAAKAGGKADGEVEGNEQKIPVEISSAVTVPVPVHVQADGNEGISEVIQLGNITKTVVIEMKSEDR